MKRKKSDTVQLSKVRMREDLRQRLARDAERNAKTLNGEIVDRLEKSYQRAEMAKISEAALLAKFPVRELAELHRPQHPVKEPDEKLLWAAKLVNVLLGESKLKAELLRQIVLELAALPDEELSKPSTARHLAERVIAIFEQHDGGATP